MDKVKYEFSGNVITEADKLKAKIKQLEDKLHYFEILEKTSCDFQLVQEQSKRIKQLEAEFTKLQEAHQKLAGEDDLKFEENQRLKEAIEKHIKEMNPLKSNDMLLLNIIAVKLSDLQKTLEE